MPVQTERHASIGKWGNETHGGTGPRLRQDASPGPEQGEGSNSPDTQVGCLYMAPCWGGSRTSLPIGTLGPVQWDNRAGCWGGGGEDNGGCFSTDMRMIKIISACTSGDHLDSF